MPQRSRTELSRQPLQAAQRLALRRSIDQAVRQRLPRGLIHMRECPGCARMLERREFDGRFCKTCKALGWGT